MITNCGQYEGNKQRKAMCFQVKRSRKPLWGSDVETETWSRVTQMEKELSSLGTDKTAATRRYGRGESEQDVKVERSAGPCRWCKESGFCSECNRKPLTSLKQRWRDLIYIEKEIILEILVGMGGAAWIWSRETVMWAMIVSVESGRNGYYQNKLVECIFSLGLK